MKKIILFLLVFVIILVVLLYFYVVEEEIGILVVYFKNWSENYDLLGIYSWGGIDLYGIYDGVDDFGVIFIYEGLFVVVFLNIEIYGWIVVERLNGLVGDLNWGNKFIGDILIKKLVVKVNEIVYVYIV